MLRCDTFAVLAALLVYGDARSVVDPRNSRSLEEPCTLLLKTTEYLDGSSGTEVECFDSSTQQYLSILGPQTATDELLAMFESGELKSGESTMASIGAYVTVDGLHLPRRGLMDVTFGQDVTTHATSSSTVTRTILALRVIANDAETTMSKTEISDAWFGTYNDPVNLRSQIKACSYGKQVFTPYVDSRIEEGGVFEVTIDKYVSGSTNIDIADAALVAANGLLGDLPSQVDHVMVCVPPGTNGSWIAYGGGQWNSAFNDNWCGYVSAQMHQIGTQLDLGYSGEGEGKYDDLSGMMGRSYPADDGPIMCFNAAKNWQLGWYSDKVQTRNMAASGKLNIYGLANYGEIQGEIGVVIVRVTDPSLNNDWFVSFNRKVGINSGTLEGGDQVLVHKQAPGNDENSLLMAKMSDGGIYSINDSLHITVESINLDENPAYATVAFLGTSNPTKTPTKNPTLTPKPTPTPTKEPTPEPIKNPTEKPTQDPTLEPTDNPTDSPTSSSTVTRTILALRVIANDAETTMSKTEISDAWLARIMTR